MIIIIQFIFREFANNNNNNNNNKCSKPDTLFWACSMTEEYYILEYNAVYSVGSKPTFRRNISPPSSGSKNEPRKKPALKQVASRALRPWGMEALYSSETSNDFQRTTRRYIPEWCLMALYHVIKRYWKCLNTKIYWFSLEDMWIVKVRMIAVIVGATGNLSRWFQKCLDCIPGKHDLPRNSKHFEEDINVALRLYFRCIFHEAVSLRDKFWLYLMDT
jgi:hypothetical protein